jgi:excisionase family DNA binding protein
MRPELQPVLVQARTLAPEDLPGLIGDLAEINAIATARLAAPAAAPEPDRMLDVEEASRRMGVSKAYLYRAHKRLSFARRQGRKLLFSSAGLDTYLRKNLR